MHVPWSRGKGRDAVTRILLLSILLLLAACDMFGSSDQPGPMTVTGSIDEIDWSMTVVDAPASLSQQELQEEIAARLQAAGAQFGDVDGALQQFNDADASDWVSVPSAFAGLVTRLQELGRETHGAYDLTRLPLLVYWGVAGDAQPARSPGRLYRERERVGVGMVEVRDDGAALLKRSNGVGLYLADLLAAYRVQQIDAHLATVDASVWRIRLGDTLQVHDGREDGDAYAVTVPFAQTELRVMPGERLAAASAFAPAAARAAQYQPLSTIIDPRTGQPVPHAGQAVTVIADSAVRARGLAQALLVMGPSAGLAYADAHDIVARFVVRETNTTVRIVRSAAYRATQEADDSVND